MFDMLFNDVEGFVILMFFGFWFVSVRIAYDMGKHLRKEKQ